MAEDIISAPIGENRVASSTGGGTALTTTASFIMFPLGSGSRDLVLAPRNFSTAVVVRYTLNPFLLIGKTTDALVAAANFTDASANMQQNPATTAFALGGLDTAANNNYVYVGSHTPFRGVRVIMGASVNSVASTLTVKYWNGSAWTDITATDGSASAGATFAANGNVTWTVPSSWQAASLSSNPGTKGNTVDTSLAVISAADQNIASLSEVYWTRWQVSAALSATVNVNSMQSMNRSTTYDELPTGIADEMRIQTHSFRGTGCVEALTDAGTANLIVKVRTVGVASRFK